MVYVGLAGNVGCVARVSSINDAALIAQPQSSTNQLALYPCSPARPSNSGDKARFVLGVSLPDRLLSATVLRVLKCCVCRRGSCNI